MNNGTTKLVRESSQEQAAHTSKELPVMWISNNFYQEQKCMNMQAIGRCGGRPCTGGGGEDSPVSVVRNFVHQLSLPSSASTSMEHPISPARSYYSHRIKLHEESAQVNDNAQIINGANVRHQSNEKGLVRSRRRIEWPSSVTDEFINSPCVNLCQNYQSKFRHADECGVIIKNGEHIHDQEEAFCRLGTKELDDDDDGEEESLIDFFPSTNRASSAMQLRRRSYEKLSDMEQGKGIDSILLGKQNEKGSHLQRASCYNNGVENDQQWRSSSKWGDGAERWLKNINNNRSPNSKNTNSFNYYCTAHVMNRDDHTMQIPANGMATTSAATSHNTSTSELLQLVHAKLLDSPAAAAQDKHVPCNTIAHEAKIKLVGVSLWHDHAVAPHMREVGTEVAVDEKKDIATQSTPMEWSRCDSPELEEDANHGSDAENPPVATIAMGTSAQQSPPRHNTPARRSVACSKQNGTKLGQRGASSHSGCLNLLELESCHLAKLKLARDLPLGTSSVWQLYPEEDTEHLDGKSPAFGASFEQQSAKFNMLEVRVSAWEDVERAKHTARFKREEAKIEAWESLQRAEADAELRKLEVKLEKMRFEGREKIRARLELAQKRALEMRFAAEAHKAEQFTRIGMRANHIRKTGHVPNSTFNIVCSLTTKIKPTSSLA